MDIVSRLKQYLDSRQISVTQFADECGIPRPSASQLLNGRNKKVSDEVITKIHLTYPSLSMLWLLFGEGDMESGENIKTSEPQNHVNSDYAPAQFTENEPNEVEISFTSPDTESEPKKPDSEPARQYSDQPKNSDTYTFTPDKRKRVIGIVVYYDDSSFESFIPDPSHRTPFA